MELTSEYDGCHCCLTPTTAEQFLIPDGERSSFTNKNFNQIKRFLKRFLKSDGTELLCYKGSWINFDKMLNDDEKASF